MTSIALWALTLTLFLIGLAGTLIPALPGVGFILAGILIFAFFTNFTVISISTTIATSFLALIALIASYAGSVVGVKASGAGKTAVFTAGIGALVGIIVNGPIGLFIGALIGTFVGAIAEGNSKEKVMKVVAYAVIGTLGATLIQFLLALAMIAVFFIDVYAI